MAAPKRIIPTEKELNTKVKLVSVKVKGDYIARIDERRRTSRRYEVDVLVPENFNNTTLKRQTPRVLLEHPDFGDFLTMRTFTQVGKPTASKETCKLADFYTTGELERMEQQRAQELAEEKNARKIVRRDGVLGGDTTEYNESTGLPDLIA